MKYKNLQVFPRVDWNQAPKWANYWAMNRDGQAFWFEQEPIQNHEEWGWVDGNIINAPQFGWPVWSALYWKQSLTRRNKDLDIVPPVDWKQAPYWANYWAMDRDGEAFWFEEEPVQNHHEWVWIDGAVRIAPDFNWSAMHWQQSLAKRREYKPIINWIDAPQEAKYWAMDSNGEAYWYFSKPDIFCVTEDESAGYWESKKEVQDFLAPAFGWPPSFWKESLTYRYDFENIGPDTFPQDFPLGKPGAEDYLNMAAAEMADRATSRDAEDGERSMLRAVKAFNELYGTELTETQGWQFMSVLKKARGAQGEYREDDYVDDIAYCALAAESAAKNG